LGGELNSMSWHELRYTHIQAIRAMLAMTCAPATANKALSAQRWVLREAVRLELMHAADYRRAVDLHPVRGSVALCFGAGLRRAEAVVHAACWSGTAPGPETPSPWQG
jgi:hypothetical protein